MIENLPAYIPIVFGFTTLVTFVLFFFALKKSSVNKHASKIGLAMFVWLGFQAAMSYSLFYLNTVGDTPPKFPFFGFVPLFIFMIVLFNTKKGKAFIDSLDLKQLTIISIVRIPVEMVLYWLFVYNTLPEILTFSGRNFDILAGITAPIIYYFGFVKGIFGKKVILAWNVISLILLFQIVISATLSFPTIIQQFGFDQPNVGILYFPFFWLPSFIVPVVFFTHFVSIRQSLKKDIV